MINKPTQAMNRGFGYVIESLADLSRFDMAGEDKKEEYLKKFREANRVVTKVGYREDIKAMGEIKKEKREYENALAEINAKTEEIQQADKKLELQLKQLDTEQEAINTEMEAVKKVIEKNIEQTFKTFA